MPTLRCTTASGVLIGVSFGNWATSVRPLVLRPRLATGLPLSGESPARMSMPGPAGVLSTFCWKIIRTDPRGCLSEHSGSTSTVSVVQAAGWYADPTGRHEWRYWRPGWGDLAADGSAEVDDPLRPRWRRYLGIALVVQLVMVPVLGFVLIRESNELKARAGLVQAVNQATPVLSVVYAPCPGERIRHIVVSTPSKGSIGEVLWSAEGDAAADTPIVVGQTPAGMTVKQRLKHPLGPHQSLVIVVSTNQLKHPAKLDFSMDDVPTAGALSYNGTYNDDRSFRTAALDATRCGAESDNNRGLLAKILVGEVVLALIGGALLVFPRYRGPSSKYA